MKLVIASDHAGYELKEHIKDYLKSLGYEFQDLGTDSTESVDYPDYSFALAEAVSRGDFPRGILVCGTGIGSCVAANKVKGIIAALCTSEQMAEMSRTHNNSNVLVLGGRITPTEEALRMVKIWLETDFLGGRHERRIEKILNYEMQH